MIVMLVIGALLSVAFVLYEWKIAQYPLMPCKKLPFSGVLEAH